MSIEKKPEQQGPLIPDHYLDVPSQRLYYLSLGGICQAIKILDFVRSLASPDLSLCRKWLLVDLIYCVVLAKLRIPRLNYSLAVILLQIATLWFLDGLLFRGINLNLSIFDEAASSSQASATSGFLGILSPLTFGLLGSSDYKSSDSHLLGQHTIRMSPISTAHLNPQNLNFCLAPPGNSILIPVLLNNTTPVSLRYSLIPPGLSDEHAELHDISGKELRAIEQARTEAIQLARPSDLKRDSDDEYEYDDDDDDDEPSEHDSHSSLQQTQSLVHIRLSKPGKLRLERILDSSSVAARLRYPSEIIVAPCPRVEFVEEHHAEIRCAGQDPDVQLMLDIYGIPPLSLRWYKSVNGRRESYLVEGIEGGHEHNPPNSDRRKGAPQKLQVPLTVSLDKVGEYAYGLEEIMDSIGNVVHVASSTSDKTRSTRSFQVLRRPSVSFRQCGPGKPTSILIGSDTSLTIAANEMESLDAPLEVSLKYLPPLSPDSDNKFDKRFKPWKKTLKSEGNRRDITLRAGSPGEYTIVDVKGKHCRGDVLAPETCQVLERPFPTAEIEWKKIHECSGDTGVSASLVMHGSPPFQVYYHVQRDKEPPQDLSKTFATSRGELTLQPERSGHYTFSFTLISDEHYRRVDLNGPSIDQVIHPLAAADFTHNSSGGSRTKKIISNCEGSSVNVDVDLRGTGPWTLEIQVVGPKSSETILFPDIKTHREILEIPIPKKVDKEGGSFEIDLVSVEDKYKCKRTLSVPGVVVNVRRVKPTARFYGDDDKRHVSVLEHELASLPLRLTGDGPWNLRYRKKEAPGQIFSQRLSSPNANLQVTDVGTYEITEVVDSQCPGSVIEGSSTYTVGWIPRPSAKLSSRTEAAYEPYNGSYILLPVCEGVSDHVDLDLVGRPPFQIMYNIAQNSELGGTRLLDQPTFNSIQPHTRFQLQTSSPGRVYYEVKQIGDSMYPLAQHRNAVIPRKERLLFEQQVSRRPTARFKTRARMSYCLNDAFVPLDPLSSDGLVILEGTPPFRLNLSIKNLVSSQVETKTVVTNDYGWKIDIPSYEFKSIGPHHIVIESVSDASGCDHAALEPLGTSIWADVAETAAIVPFDRREDYCVGDVAQFQLEGTPPWTIGYRFNGKLHTQEAKTSPFSLVQQQPGELTIASIAHQQKKCKAAVTDLRFITHPLPSAQVGHGKRIYQDIHEGDQAEIVFTLIGTPPFTFTYQRSEPSPKKGAKPGKVLETHTVSRVFSNEYSIYSALEGTWTITSISDKYCRYPPSQSDVDREGI